MKIPTFVSLLFLTLNKEGGLGGNHWFPPKEGVVGETLVSPHEGGNGAKHNLISPREATSYFTINGKSLPKYISK